MKKMLAFLLTAAVMLSLTACAPANSGGNAAGTENSGENVPPPENEEEELKLVSSGVTWDADGELNVLAIGNSFSDDTLWYLREIAVSAGIEKVNVYNLHIGGCVLSSHAINAMGDAARYQFQSNVDGNWTAVDEYKMSDGIKHMNWDFISLQQGSIDSGDVSTFGDLKYLVEYVRTLAGPDTKIIWNMTWAYQSDYNVDNSFVRYANDQMTMYEAITRVAQSKVINTEGIEILVPSGTAIQNVRTSYIGDTATRDGYHLDYLTGRYTAGLTYFASIVGEEYLDKVTFVPTNVQEHGGLVEGEEPVTMDEKMKAVCIEAVRNAIAKPFEVTQSAITERKGEKV